MIYGRYESTKIKELEDFERKPQTDMKAGYALDAPRFIKERHAHLESGSVGKGSNLLCYVW